MPPPSFSAMEIDVPFDDNTKRIQVRFITKLQPPLKLPNAVAIAIPSNLTRSGLSDIVNNLLKSNAENEEWKRVPFDFLIGGRVMGVSLEEFLIDNGISAEKILEIEYITTVAPQKEEEPCLHDDWISAVDASNPGFILTGCYDGLGRIWKAAGICTHVLEGHSRVITSVNVINPGSENAQQVRVATCSDDRTLRLWKIDADSHSQKSLKGYDSSNHPVKLTAYKILRGHSASVKSVSSQPSGNMVCSGSWDFKINLWQTSEIDAEGDLTSLKKRKKGDAVTQPLMEAEAVSTLVGHTQGISSVVWAEDDSIYSASWDHSVRRWDIETSSASWTLFCDKPLNYIDVGGESSALIAAGASDSTLRIWDPRLPGTERPLFKLSSHASWISACKWHKTSNFHLLSASYDGKIRLWDLRAKWPLTIINSHKDKALCVDWWSGDTVVSGGADSKLRIASGVSVQ